MTKTPTERVISDSASPYPSRSTSRSLESGYERCPHQCTAQPCPSNKRGPLWPKEGNSLCRHIKRRNVHIFCSPSCRSYLFMSGQSTLSDVSAFMTPTKADFESALRTVNDPEIKDEINNYMLSPVCIALCPRLAFPDLFPAIHHHRTRYVSAEYRSRFRAVPWKYKLS